MSSFRMRICITLFKNLFSPSVVKVTWTYAHLLIWMLSIVILKKALIMSVQVAIVLRRHIAAISPCLISDSEIIDYKRLFPSVLSTLKCQWAFSVKCHVFNPLTHFLKRACTHISVNVCLTA